MGTPQGATAVRRDWTRRGGSSAPPNPAACGEALCRLRQLSQQVLNHVAVVDDRDRPAILRQELFLWVDAHQVEEGRAEVFGSVGVGGRAFGAVVGLADDDAALDPAAAEGHGEGRPPVVAAGVPL